METVRFIACALLILTGLTVLFSAALGNWRFRGPLPRMHFIAMGDSVGTLCVFLGLLLCEWDGLAKLKLLLILVFFWTSGPVCSHLLCKYQVDAERIEKEEGKEDKKC